MHAALAEFDLALKALETYIEIVVSAKDRAEKAAEIGDLENDEILLQTVSEGVLLLCCFGAENEARKAKDLIAILEKYIKKRITNDLGFTKNNEEKRVSPRVIAMTYKVIGIGLGNWSRWTPINEARNDIRAEAIENLERSIAPELGSENDLASRYALALLLAESRDLDGAINHVRSALSSRDGSTHPTSVTYELHQTYLSQERDRIPLWHLLALLLSAKQEFDIAGRSCEAAFDQLPSSVTTLVRNIHGVNGKQDFSEKKKDFIQYLQGREKERIIETRMTQLALLEITDGPEVAVNHSDNLLSLFATLFEDLELEATKEKVTKFQHRLEPPKSSAETVKSFRGSIFGRKKGSKVPDRIPNTEDIPPLPNGGSSNASTDAPMIKVTAESAIGAQPGQQESFSKDNEMQESNQNEPTDTTDVAASEKDRTEAEEIGIVVSKPQQSPTSPTDSKDSAKHPSLVVSRHHSIKTEPRPAKHYLGQNIHLPTPHRFDSPTKALTKFPIIQAQKHALSLLVKVWLLISSMYRRASLYDDAREACEEASKQVEAFETLVAAEESSTRAFAKRAWGVAKSADELSADVLAEKGTLSEAQSLTHEAMQYYEEAIARFPDHPRATIGLSNLLLDAWEKKFSLEPQEPRIDSDVATSPSLEPTAHSHSEVSEISSDATTKPFTEDIKATLKMSNNVNKPEYLSRLAARDRAYGLVSMLTKTGTSWDHSEAWFTLSRAYEAGSQIEKAKEILWWCIELEDRKPIRHWWNMGAGGYVL